MARLKANVYVLGQWYGHSYPEASVTQDVIDAVDADLVEPGVGASTPGSSEPPPAEPAGDAEQEPALPSESPVEPEQRTLSPQEAAKARTKGKP